VEVHVQIESRPEALDEGDGAALLRANAPKPPRAPAKPREQGTDEGAHDFAREPRVVGAAVAECVGERENPLPHRRFRQHAIDQMCRRIRHATSTARWTEAAALARERDQAIVAALVAVESKEAVCENSTAKERARLLLDEARGRALTGTGVGQESLQRQQRKREVVSSVNRVQQEIARGGGGRHRTRPDILGYRKQLFSYITSGRMTRKRPVYLRLER
jgi:hypothetical protein